MEVCRKPAVDSSLLYRIKSSDSLICNQAPQSSKSFPFQYAQLERGGKILSTRESRMISCGSQRGIHLVKLYSDSERR